MMTCVHTQEAEHELRHGLHGLHHQALLALRLAHIAPRMRRNTGLGPVLGRGDEDLDTSALNMSASLTMSKLRVVS